MTITFEVRNAYYISSAISGEQSPEYAKFLEEMRRTEYGKGKGKDDISETLKTLAEGGMHNGFGDKLIIPVILLIT